MNTIPMTVSKFNRDYMWILERVFVYNQVKYFKQVHCASVSFKLQNPIHSCFNKLVQYERFCKIKVSILDQIEDFKISSKNHILLLLKQFLPEVFKDTCSDSEKFTPNIKLPGWNVDSSVCTHLVNMESHTLLCELSEVPLTCFMFNYP
jgi:hypothetical protein